MIYIYIGEVIRRLKINFEFRKGLLFIRLEGKLTKKTSKELSKTLDRFIYEQGVKYFVINLESLEFIDQNGLEVIRKKYKDMILHNGKLIVCGYQKDAIRAIVEKDLKEVHKTKNELMAFQMIQI